MSVGRTVPLVTSLLTAIVRADGDALVLHAGERPYVVAPAGQTELASRGLTLDAMKGMLKELLPADAQQALADVGAVQHELPPHSFAGPERFTVIAARGGDDIWIEIRRRRAPAVAVPVAPAVEVPVAPSIAPPVAVADAPPSAPPVQFQERVEWSAQAPAPAPEPMLYAVAQDDTLPAPAEDASDEPEVVEISLDDAIDLTDMSSADRDFNRADDIPAVAEEPAELVELPPAVQSVRKTGPVEVTPAVMTPGTPTPEPVPDAVPEPRPAVVLPLSRPHTHTRVEHPIRFSPVHTTGIERLLGTAAARGASMLYLTSQSRPSIRVNGEIVSVDGEGVLSEAEVEALVLDIIPERSRETLRGQAGAEWMCDVPDVGRIRCVTFRDHRGLGAMFRMLPARAISAEHLGLSYEIQGLCAEAEGLVIVTGPRASGKSTLLSAFVDLINRTRSDHVITLETQIKFVHENRLSLVSQREVRGDASELVNAARAALRENPDVLAIEDFGSPDIVALALEAAQSGRLVIGAIAADTAAGAIDRLVEVTPPERRPKVQSALAEHLRGVVAQVLLRKIGGGRVAARELLLGTSAVAGAIAEGRTSQLQAIIDNGRRQGMVALNDALVTFVQDGVVDSREAFRRAADQQGFLAQLKRHGIDTSFVERLA